MFYLYNIPHLLMLNCVKFYLGKGIVLESCTVRFVAQVSVAD